jgi:triphosphoribosyl-dephospho-CoA synthase
MRRYLTREEVGRAAQAACLVEVSVHKPGNVSPIAGFRDARFEEYMLSALAIGPAMARAHRHPVGATILRAVRATRRVVATNTNLGTVFLFAPLARAYGAGELRAQVRRVLASLTVDDARAAYRAIRMVRPGGLGTGVRYDVRDEPTVSLRTAMASAADRDTIAREYAAGFPVTFGTALPALERWRQRLSLREAVVQTFLTILAAVPDTLIARKTDAATAAAVSKAAADVLAAGGVTTRQGRRRLQDLDRWLRSRGNRLNPGTTADLTAAALFVAILEHGFEVLRDAGA